MKTAKILGPEFFQEKAPYSLFINLGNKEYLVGGSPEVFIKVTGNRVESCPISGTIKKGNTVSNLSSTRALYDVSKFHGVNYFASAVGEVNVVEKMKEVDAVIGGEGNGGVIFPELHYGRDSLVGVALFLTHLAKSKISCSELRRRYRNYFMSKQKVQLTEGLNVDALLELMANKYKNEDVDCTDGVKINFNEEWVHLRKSNTEPIIRVYTESVTSQKADALALRFIKEINDL